MLALHQDRGVVIGVDTHNDTHTAAAVGATGAVLEHLTVSADPAGYRQLIGFGRRHDATLWAIEGTGSFGAGLTTALLARCERIVEVDRPQRPAASWRGEERRYRRRAGGPAGARRCRPQRAAPPRGPGSHPGAAGHPRASGHVPDTGPSRRCTRPAPLTVFASGSGGCRWDSCCTPAPGLRDSSRRSVEESATVLAMRSTARRALACQREAAELEVQLDRLVRRLAPELLGQLGIGPVVAGQVITSWSHHGRIRSEAAFAKLGGAAPIQASSGTITRHRLNRSGDRQLNRALHTIVLVRMRQDSATKEYVQRRLAQGKTIRDIKRCLKRYIARQLFRQLEALSPTT